MSVAYGKRLDDATWNTVVEYLDTVLCETANCTVDEIEVVAYSNFEEHLTVLKAQS